MPEDERTTERGSVEFRIGELKGRVDSHDQKLAEINDHLDRQDAAAAQRQRADEERISELKHLLEGDVDRKLNTMLEIQDKAQRATERRLLIAEGALASYVAGETHRRDRMRNIERAVYGTGATLLTGLILLLFGQFFGHPHSAATLGNDAVSAAAIVLLVAADMFMGWRVAALSSTALAHSTPTPPDPAAQVP